MQYCIPNIINIIASIMGDHHLPCAFVHAVELGCKLSGDHPRSPLKKTQQLLPGVA